MNIILKIEFDLYLDHMVGMRFEFDPNFGSLDNPNLNLWLKMV